MATDDVETWILVAETKEFVGPITLTADGDPVTAFEVTVVQQGLRPTTWRTPTNTGTEGAPRLGVMVGTGTDFPLAAGYRYSVFTRYADTPEQPVDMVGYLRVR